MRVSILALLSASGLSAATQVLSEWSASFDSKLQLQLAYNNDWSHKEDGHKYQQQQCMYQPQFGYQKYSGYDKKQKFVIIGVDQGNDKYIHYVHQDHYVSEHQNQLISSSQAYHGYWAPGYLGESGKGKEYSYLVYKQPDNFKLVNLPKLGEKVGDYDKWAQGCGLDKPIAGCSFQVDIMATSQEYGSYKMNYNQHSGYDHMWNYMPKYNMFNQGCDVKGNYQNQYNKGYNQYKYRGCDKGCYNQQPMMMQPPPPQMSYQAPPQQTYQQTQPQQTYQQQTMQTYQQAQPQQTQGYQQQSQGYQQQQQGYQQGQQQQGYQQQQQGSGYQKGGYKRDGSYGQQQQQGYQQNQQQGYQQNQQQGYQQNQNQNQGYQQMMQQWQQYQPQGGYQQQCYKPPMQQTYTTTITSMTPPPAQATTYTPTYTPPSSPVPAPAPAAATQAPAPAPQVSQISDGQPQAPQAAASAPYPTSPAAAQQTGPLPTGGAVPAAATGARPSVLVGAGSSLRDGARVAVAAAMGVAAFALLQ